MSEVGLAAEEPMMATEVLSAASVRRSRRRLHGFESINKRKLLPALDFLGEVDDLLAQPMTLKFTTTTTCNASRPIRSNHGDS